MPNRHFQFEPSLPSLSNRRKAMNVRSNPQEPPAPARPERAIDRKRALDLERYVPALLIFLANKTTLSASRIYRKRFKVSPTEWRVMAMLGVEPDITAKRICDVIGFNKAAVSRTLHALIKRGLVEATPIPGNSRSSLLALTEEGWDLHEQILDVVLEREKRLLADFAPEEVEALIDYMNRMHRTIIRMDRPRT